MEDVSESSSKSKITVTGINDFTCSPHQVNKKAYDITFTVDGDYEFRLRLWFNMFKLPMGEPWASTPSWLNTSLRTKAICTKATLSAVSFVMNVGQQSSKTFTPEGYVRSIIHLHKWQVSPPEFLTIDMNDTLSPRGQ